MGVEDNRLKMKNSFIRWLLVCAILIVNAACLAADTPAPKAETETESPTIAVPEKMGEAIIKEAEQVKEDIQQQVLTLSRWTPLGWNLKTIDYITQWLLQLPLRVPELMQKLLAHGRVLGAAGSLVMLTFLATVFYSLFGRNRVMRQIEAAIQPVRHRIPQPLYPFFTAGLRVVVAAAIPLLLLAVYSAIETLITYRAVWFTLTGRLLGLWSLAALSIGLLRELLTRDLFKVTADHGPKVFQIARLVLIYLLVGVVLYWCAEAFRFPKDVLAFLQFAVSVSVVCIFLLLMLNKRALLSFLPPLPYRSYQNYVRILDRYYYPLIGASFVLALLWCFGFREVGRLLLVKIWSTAGALILLSLVYHMLRLWLNRWAQRVPLQEESAQFLIDSVRSFLMYATAVAAAALLLNMIGLLEPIERVLSFPVVTIGKAGITIWVVIKALLILFFFIYASRLLQAYLDYKVYPAFGVEQGPGYALNTIIRLAFFGVGLLIALDTVGVDFGFLLVFAGAIGVGIGLGLQSMAANLISGFIIIFGGKVRKGDWIKVEDAVGMVTDIHPFSTRVRTRGNVEYLLPNSNLVSTTIVNYTLSSPMVWISLAVGVAYDSDPRQIERILLAVAAREPMVSKLESPRVLFTEFADSSLNFDLVVCIDVRLHAERVVKSNLYFAIFEEFTKAGVVIPFPQREVTVRTPGGGQPEAAQA
jgi:small-conductance mechanosensitive channel